VAANRPASARSSLLTSGLTFTLMIRSPSARISADGITSSMKRRQ
jgi:hypothetical protein